MAVKEVIELAVVKFNQLAVEIYFRLVPKEVATKPVELAPESKSLETIEIMWAGDEVTNTQETVDSSLEYGEAVAVTLSDLSIGYYQSQYFLQKVINQRQGLPIILRLKAVSTKPILFEKLPSSRDLGEAVLRNIQ